MLQRRVSCTSNTHTSWLTPTPPAHTYTHVHPEPRSRQRLEVRLSRAVNALSAAWRRLQLLQEAVVDQGSALSEPQLAKERELIVDTRDRLKQLQVG